MNTAQRLHATVSGKVQGVGFRYFVAKQARDMELDGHVRNLPARNHVEVIAEGPKPTLEKLAELLRCGPPLAEVTSVTLKWKLAKGGLPKFTVRG
ncbi:MAG: acylphosphatase [Chloroflexi bacterium]|nr:acylphosphatase [Chloroflexota bacterium]HCU72378.1 acylphosphatase [Chloroflexota bacterium]|tara:strand:- start:39 stop:323 length:285 start_codon:yes stop_codon:yes gene_type:complete